MEGLGFSLPLPGLGDGWAGAGLGKGTDSPSALQEWDQQVEPEDGGLPRESTQQEGPRASPGGVGYSYPGTQR